MLKSIIAILIGIIVFLVGLVVSISENLSTDTYWIGIGLIGAGIVIIAVSVMGKIKNWF
ncbi:MAG: hypothetical protein ACE5R3_02115 [Nitrosopumilaceae archaeon]